MSSIVLIAIRSSRENRKKTTGPTLPEEAEFERTKLTFGNVGEFYCLSLYVRIIGKICTCALVPSYLEAFPVQYSPVLKDRHLTFLHDNGISSGTFVVTGRRKRRRE